MADVNRTLPFTDEMLVEELNKFGENLSLPIKSSKREILRKKLNHYRARDKQLQNSKPKMESKHNESKSIPSPHHANRGRSARQMFLASGSRDAISKDGR